MDDLQKIVDKLHEDKDHQEIIKKAKDKFAYKPAIKSLRSLYLTAKYSRFILGGFSILTGCMFFIYLFPGNVVLSTVIAILLFGLLEVTKNLLSDKAFTSYYASGKLNLYFIGTFLTLALSVFCSVHGVKDMYKGLDSSIESLDMEYASKIDSIENVFDLRIGDQKQELEEYKKSVTYRGKINIHNPVTKSVLGDYNTRITDLETAKTLYMKNAFNEFSEGKTALKHQNTFNQNTWMIVSLITELLIIVSLWFITYYYYSIAKDDSLISTEYRLNTASLGNFADFFRLSNSNTLPPASNEDSTIPRPIRLGRENNIAQNTQNNDIVNQPSSRVLPPETPETGTDQETKEIVNDYENEIGQLEDTIKKKTIKPRPCKLCSKMIKNPGSKETAYHIECRKDKNLIIRWVGRGKRYESIQDNDKAKELYDNASQLIAAKRGIKFDETLYKIFM